MFPNEIEKIIQGMKIKKDEIGESGDEVYLIENAYVLKISSNIDSLKSEMEKINWLEDKLMVSRSICFCEEKGKAFYLRTQLEGTDLIHKTNIENPKLIVDILVEAINMLRKVPPKNCPFKSSSSDGKSFVHGDLCLPNILVKNGKLNGFLDLDNCGLGDPWEDYAMAVWSLEYNLGTREYTSDFLKKAEIKWEQEKYDLYRVKE